MCARFGILRPRLLISRSVVDALSADELDAVLEHENAHLDSADNLKRLLLVLAPRYRGAAWLEREWAHCAELAADDRAAAGDAHRSLALASALVRVARLGPGPRVAQVSTRSADGNDLAERVERLLDDTEPAAEGWAGRAGWWIAAGTAAAAIAFVVQPASLQAVQAMLERLVH